MLCQLDLSLLAFARNCLCSNIEVFSGNAFQPDGEFWYILIRSIALSGISNELKLNFIRLCQSNNPKEREILEGVIEALVDIGCEDSASILKGLLGHQDPFIAELAEEAISDWE